jgi:hypothetical protein
MNKPIKASLVGATFLITGLCGSLSYATSDIKHQSNAYKQDLAMVDNTINNNASNSYTFSRSASKVFTTKEQIGIPSFSNIARKPLQGIQIADFAHITPNGLQKKNSIFEFAAKFNDKLQQILAIFDFSSAKSSAKKENVSQKIHQRKIHLSNNTDNCIISKS